MAHIHSINYYLPKKELTNEELSQEFPEWNVEKISSKTGISNVLLQTIMSLHQIWQLRQPTNFS